jgi:hypothetical protein
MRMRFDRLSAVSRAAARCGRRRVARSWTAAAAILAALAALPAIGVVAGEQAAEVLRPALAAHPSVALSLALSVGTTAGLAGVLVATVAPRRSFLGAQLAAAPLRPLAVFAVVTCVPVIAAGAVASVIGLAFLVPALGADTAPAAVAAGWAGFSLGAAAAEGALAVRASPAGLAAVAGVAGLWALASAGAGAGALVGPFGYLAAAVNGEPTVFGPPVPALVCVAVLGLGLWALAAAMRPEEQSARAMVRAVLPVPSRPVGAAFAAAVKRYARRRELRRHATGVIVLAGGGGVLLGASLGVEPEPVLLFAGGLAALGAAAVPLAAAGIDAEAEWLWRAAPIRRGVLAAAAMPAAQICGLAAAAAAVAPVVAWGRPAGRPVVEVLAVAVFCAAAATLAGALVPWRVDRPAEQLASLAAFAAVAGGLWLALSRAATAVPGPAMTAALLAGEAALAVAVSAVLAGRSSRC